MITDAFLNSCFIISFCKSKVRVDSSIYRDIKEILEISTKNKDIPVLLKNKFDCVNKICDLKLTGKTCETIVDSLYLSEKYKEILDLILEKTSSEVNDNIILDHIKQIRLRKKLNCLYKNYEKLSTLLEKMKELNFDSIDELVMNYEDTVKILYSDMVDQNKSISIEATCSLDLVKDNYDPVISKIIKKYDRVNITPTGFNEFDNYILNGGFEPSRLYVIAGAAASGKSTLLGNFITNSIRTLSMMPKTNKNNVYIYITLENTIEEALLRIYQSLYSKTSSEVMSEIISGIDLKKKLMTELSKNNTTIIMKYFIPGTISTTDLMAVVDGVIEEYGKDSIRGLYIDYLDLLRSDIKYDINWLEIGHVALSLKSLAVQYDIPVITPTHLNSSSYASESYKDLSLNLMSKSIQKVEHADFVSLQVRDPNDENIVHLKVGKNRSGKSNLYLDFKVDFVYFKFLNAYKPSNDNSSQIVKNNHGYDNFESSNCL